MSAEEKLCVKELAAGLGVSAQYVYQMRACGFVMEGLKRYNRTSTVEAAVAWVRENDFRLVQGKGKVERRNDPPSRGFRLRQTSA